jgi:hypothetical protein
MMEAAAIVRQPKYSVKLPAVLHETSGLVFSDNILWTTNDDTDTTIYGVDTSGLIQKKNSIKKYLTGLGRDYTRQQLFYIGDFGNNVSGNRKDLHILRIEKNSVEGNIQKLIPFHSRIPIRLISRN